MVARGAGGALVDNWLDMDMSNASIRPDSMLGRYEEIAAELSQSRDGVMSYVAESELATD
jgi:hypothetical protein